MKKLSNIYESVWADMHRVSTGAIKRKEDDINILDKKDLCYYLKTIYKSSNSSIHDNIYILQNYYLAIRLYQDEDGYFRFLYYDGSSIETRYDVLETINCISEIKQKYTINTYTDDFDVKIATIYPKDRARVPVTNRFFIEIIDFFLDRINVPLEQQIEKITESVWTDMHRISTGETTRKENNINLLDLNEFYNYIKEQYKSKVEYIDLDTMGDGYGGVLGVDITEHIMLFYKPKRGHILLYWSKVKIQMPLFDELTDIFKVENPNPMRRIITEKDGSCTNKTFIDVIEFFLRHKDDLVNESVWVDMHRISTGETTRKENDITNIKSIKPIDMGVSVLWADKDLEYGDGDCYFDYNEASNIIKNSKWRIPTKQESYELFQYTTMIKNTDEVCIQEGKFDDKPQLVFNKKGYQYGDNDKIFQKSTYAMWTSTEIKETEAYYMSVIARMNDNHYTSMHYRNRLCVRLVQDRK